HVYFFPTRPEANMILQAERGVPIANKVLAALKAVSTPMVAESFDLVSRATAYATKLPPIDPPAWDTILTTIFTPQITTPIMNHQLTPEDGVALFRQKATAALAAAGP